MHDQNVMDEQYAHTEQRKRRPPTVMPPGGLAFSNARQDNSNDKTRPSIFEKVLEWKSLKCTGHEMCTGELLLHRQDRYQTLSEFSGLKKNNEADKPLDCGDKSPDKGQEAGYLPTTQLGHFRSKSGHDRLNRSHPEFLQGNGIRIWKPRRASREA